MLRVHPFISGACVALALVLAAFDGPPRSFAVGAFSEATPGALPAGWAVMPLGDVAPSTYETVRSGDATVVRARADKSASGLIRKITIDTRDFPVLEWRWRAEGVLRGGDMTRRGGDDYAARIYITFDYDPSELSVGERLKYEAARALSGQDIPVRALSYVWANEPRPDAPVANAYTDWVMMIPVEGGTANVGRWVAERRNVAEDYRRAFGEEPPAITGIAIMTDADNTGEAVTAYYGDLVLRSAGGAPAP